MARTGKRQEFSREKLRLRVEILEAGANRATDRVIDDLEIEADSEREARGMLDAIQNLLEEDFDFEF